MQRDSISDIHQTTRGNSESTPSNAMNIENTPTHDNANTTRSSRTRTATRSRPYTEPSTAETRCKRSIQHMRQLVLRRASVIQEWHMYLKKHERHLKIPIGGLQRYDTDSVKDLHPEQASTLQWLDYTLHDLAEQGSLTDNLKHAACLTRIRYCKQEREFYRIKMRYAMIVWQTEAIDHRNRGSSTSNAQQQQASTGESAMNTAKAVFLRQQRTHEMIYNDFRHPSKTPEQRKQLLDAFVERLDASEELGALLRRGQIISRERREHEQFLIDLADLEKTDTEREAQLSLQDNSTAEQKQQRQLIASERRFEQAVAMSQARRRNFEEFPQPQLPHERLRSLRS